MQASSVSTATFASKTPRSTLVATSRQPSNRVPPSTVTDTQFSFGGLNTIRQVTEPSSSHMTSAFKSNVPTVISSPQDKHSSIHGIPSNRKNNKPVRTITLQAPKSFQAPPLKLKPIQQQQRQQQQQIQLQPEQTFWEKVQAFFNRCNCCKRSEHYRGMSSSW